MTQLTRQQQQIPKISHRSTRTPSHRGPPHHPRTAKLSPIILNRTLSFGVDPHPRHLASPAADQKNTMSSSKGRRRRSSSLMYTEPPESLEHISDQSALPNLNSEWVNAKGAWAIHIILILALKIFYDIIPGVSQETSWTLTNISYMFGSYLMFHWVRGVPFEFNAGAYDNLNMWEQIDNGDQYTPAKKFLLTVPVVLFLVSTHYTHYGVAYFVINFLATMAVVIPKLPASHRLRIGLFSGPPPDDVQ
ncbi:sphingolipid homeostasis protein orm1 [Coniosporium tulheliwenetii]|uniref:Sphingolipid homeostasis protein orm1 n=1 Tax=Coniosporium tulheliwenetii TaxID=3383036 RepID=A0ACC2Z0B9_9PEZI|nr:sphingolipid homeostasis protein orm1 [Cladosporium sp. JES 115]